MQFLEKNLEDIIFNAPILELGLKGLLVDKNRKRQVRIGNYGIADMITVSRVINNKKKRHLRFTIYELKQAEINVDTFMQSIKYAKGLQDYLSTKKNLGFNDYKIVIRLIGSKVSFDSSFIYLNALIQSDKNSTTGLDLELYKYEYDWDGINFKKVSTNYSLINTGFDGKGASIF